MSNDSKSVLRGGFGIFRDQFWVNLYGIDRFLPPFFGLLPSIFRSFPSPQNALLRQPLLLYSMTYHPKSPYALQYNLHLEREVAPGTILTQNPFAQGGNADVVFRGHGGDFADNPGRDIQYGRHCASDSTRRPIYFLIRKTSNVEVSWPVLPNSLVP
jgi:hypothetical protein